MEGLEEVPDRARAHVVALLAECLGEPAGALTGPPPRRPRVAASRRLHQRIQGLEPPLILGGHGLATCPVAAQTPRHRGRLGWTCSLLFAKPNRAFGQPCGSRDRRDAPVSETMRLGRCPQASRPFVSLGLEGLIRGFARLFLRA